MAIKTESRHVGDFLISEANGTRSREEVVVASGEGKLVAGTVLGKITASGKYAAYDNAASDGTQAAAAVLYAGVDATAADAAAVIIARDAEAVEAYLTGLDAPGKVDLAAIGIIVR